MMKPSDLHTEYLNFVKCYLEFDENARPCWPSFQRKYDALHTSYPAKLLSSSLLLSHFKCEDSNEQIQHVNELVVINTMMRSPNLDGSRIARLFQDLWMKFTFDKKYQELIESKLFILHATIILMDFEGSYELLEEVRSLFQIHILSLRDSNNGDGGDRGVNRNNKYEQIQILDLSICKLQYHMEAISVHMYIHIGEWEKAYASCQTALMLLSRLQTMTAMIYFLKTQIKLLVMLERDDEIRDELSHLDQVLKGTHSHPHPPKYEWLARLMSSRKTALMKFCDAVQVYLSMKSCFNDDHDNQNNAALPSERFGPNYDPLILPKRGRDDKEYAGLWYFSVGNFWKDVMGNASHALYCFQQCLDNSITVLSKEDMQSARSAATSCQQSLNRMKNTSSFPVVEVMGKWFTVDYASEIEKINFFNPFTWYLLKTHGFIQKHRKIGDSTTACNGRFDLLVEEHASSAFKQSAGSSGVDSHQMQLMLKEFMAYLCEEDKPLTLMTIYCELIRCSGRLEDKTQYWTKLVEVMGSWVFKRHQDIENANNGKFLEMKEKLIHRFIRFWLDSSFLPPTSELRKQCYRIYRQIVKLSEEDNNLLSRIDRIPDDGFHGNSQRRQQQDSAAMLLQIKSRMEVWVMFTDPVRKCLDEEVYADSVALIKAFVETTKNRDGNSDSFVTLGSSSQSTMSIDFAFTWKSKLTKLHELLQRVFNGLDSYAGAEPVTLIGLECCLTTLNLLHWLFPRYYQYASLDHELQQWLSDLKLTLMKVMKQVTSDQTFFDQKSYFLRYVAGSYIDHYSYGSVDSTIVDLHAKCLQTDKDFLEIVNNFQTWSNAHCPSLSEMCPKFTPVFDGNHSSGVHGWKSSHVLAMKEMTNLTHDRISDDQIQRYYPLLALKIAMQKDDQTGSGYVALDPMLPGKSFDPHTVNDKTKSFHVIEMIQGILLSSTMDSLRSLCIRGEYESQLFGNIFAYSLLAWKCTTLLPNAISISSPHRLCSLTFSYSDCCDYQAFFEVLKYSISLETLKVERNTSPICEIQIRENFMKESFLLNLAESLEILSNDKKCELKELHIDFIIDPLQNFADRISPIFFMIRDISGKFEHWRTNRLMMKSLLSSTGESIARFGAPTMVIPAQPLIPSLKSFTFSMDYLGQMSTLALIEEELDLLILAWQRNPNFISNELLNHSLSFARLDPILIAMKTSSVPCLQHLTLAHDIFTSRLNANHHQTVQYLVEVCQHHCATLRSLTLDNCGMAPLLFHGFLESLLDNGLMFPELQTLKIIGLPVTGETMASLAELIQASAFPQLRNLCIQSAQLVDGDFENLIAALMSLETSLCSLDIGQNNLTSACFPMLIAWLVCPTTVHNLQSLNLQGNVQLKEADELMIVQTFARCYFKRFPKLTGPNVDASSSKFLKYLTTIYEDTKDRIEADLSARSCDNYTSMTVEEVLRFPVPTSSFSSFVGYLLQWWKVLEPYQHWKESIDFIHSMDASFLCYGTTEEILEFTRFAILHLKKFSERAPNANALKVLPTHNRRYYGSKDDDQHFEILFHHLRHSNRLRRSVFIFCLQYLEHISFQRLLKVCLEVVVEESKNVLTRILSTTTTMMMNQQSTISSSSLSSASSSSSAMVVSSYTSSSYIDGLEALKTLIQQVAGDKSQLQSILRGARDQWSSIRANVVRNEDDNMSKMVSDLSKTRLENILIWMAKSYFSCMIEVAQHVNDYGDLFTKAMNEMITDWYQQESNFQLQYGQQQQQHPAHANATPRQEVFDLSTEDALKGYVILRYKTRQAGTNREIQAKDRDLFSFLVSIPSIRQLIVQDFQAHGLGGGENALLRIAIEVGNVMAAQLFLSIDAVYQLASRHNFYAQSARSGLDIRQLANDRESSMMNLTTGEEQRLKKLQTHYMPMIQERGGVDAVFMTLVEHLESEYMKDPVQWTIVCSGSESNFARETTASTDPSEGQAMDVSIEDKPPQVESVTVTKERMQEMQLDFPLKWLDLIQMLAANGLIDETELANEGKNLISALERQSSLQDGQNTPYLDVHEILRRYHQHTVHTAWRYLQKPNAWMSPRAQYVERNTAMGRYSTFEQYKQLIVLLYTAAIDPNLIGPHRYTALNRFQHFVKELAFINRAHNWDHTRKKRLVFAEATGEMVSVETEESEEYDMSSEGDRPSCSSGVKRRLFQSLMDHPYFMVLTVDVIYLEMKEYFQQLFVEKLNHRLDLASNPLNALQRYRDAWDTWVLELNEEGLSVLKELDITEDSDDTHVQTLRMMFETILDNKYGEAYRNDPLLCSHTMIKFSLLCPLKPSAAAVNASANVSPARQVSQLVQLGGLIDVNMIFKKCTYHGMSDKR